MKISKLIRELKRIERKAGDVEVYLSQDSEGNGFGTIVERSLSLDENVLIVYPWEEYLSYEQIQTGEEK